MTNLKSTWAFVALLTLGAVSSAWADVCVTIDSARDTFSEADRTGAILVITRQFEREGERVVPAGCPRAFTLSHIRLLETIVVRLQGPDGEREAIARGGDDLPAVYSQMVRSLLTGRPMTGLNVTDRTNVTQTQAAVRRVHTDSTWYARVGYGALFGDTTYSAPAIGFGFRAEMDTYAIDVAFLNTQFSRYRFDQDHGTANTILKLSGLRFVSPQADRSLYFGGGLGYGYQNFERSRSNVAQTYYDGNGLQGELTAGYEIGRATGLRIFVQADAVLPFYKAVAETFTFPPGTTRPTSVTSEKYAPSLVISIGLGR